MADMRPSFDSTVALTRKSSRPKRFAAVRATPPVAGREATSGLVGAMVFATGLTGVFLAQLFDVRMLGRSAAEAVAVGRLAYLAWALALWGAYAFAKANHCALWENRRTRWWLASYAGVVFLMFCRGILNWILGDRVELTGYITDCIIYVTPFVLIPCGGLLLRSKSFQIVVALHAACGGLLGLAFILGNGLTTRLDYGNRDSAFSFQAMTTFYAVPFALLLLPQLPRFLAVGVLAGAVGALAFAVTFQSRITSLTLVCVLCFVIAGVLRDRRRSGRGNVMIVAGLVVIGLLVFAQPAWRVLSSENLSEGFEALKTRWQGEGGSVTTVTGDPRYEEAGIVVEQMSPLDWAVGRGIGGHWSDVRLYDGDIRTMVHVGYLYFAFMGGVGLWWLICGAPLVSAVRCWRMARGVEYVAVAYLLVRAIELCVYGIAQFSPLWLFVCICLGEVIEAASRRGSMLASSGGASRDLDRRSPWGGARARSLP